MRARCTSTSSAHGAASTISPRPPGDGSRSRRQAPAFPVRRRAASQRVVLRFACWHPIDRQWSFSARAEAGVVFAQARNGIPAALLFRTGGDTTVRGYAFESLGIKQGDAMLPARYYYATSVEATRWIGEALGHRGVRRRRQRVRRSFGGAGPRSAMASARACRTPIGPFRLDVAYGEEVATGAAPLLRRRRVLKRMHATADTPPPTTARNEPRRRALKITLGVFALLAIAVAALIGYALSERGLPFIVARIVAQTGGRITVDDPTGSVAGTMRFRRITWRGVDATVIADDVVVEWNPGALWSKRLSIRGLGARRVDIALKPSTGADPAADRSRAAPRRRHRSTRRRRAHVAGGPADRSHFGT